MEDPSSVVASAILSDFYKHNHSPPVLLRTCKTLLLLLKNASTKSDDKYKTIKLSNKTIQRDVVQVADALDVLAVAGFVVAPNDCLAYTPCDGAHDMATCLCGLLQIKIQELEPEVTETKKPATIKNTEDTPFLSDEERKRRVREAKAFRKANEEARKAEKRRWQEEREDKLEAAKLKEQVQNAQDVPPQKVLSLQELAASRRIRKVDSIETSKPDTPMEVELPEEAIVVDGLSLQELAASRRIRKDESVETSNPDTPMVDEPNENDHQKPLNIPPLDSETDELWKSLSANVCTCGPAPGVRDTSVLKNMGDSRPVTCLKRLYQELQELSSSLPNDRLASIFIRYDEDTPQYLRALITAPLGTPYAGGMFCFDIYVPNDYPQVPPKVVLLTTGGGRVRFGPNLYADGKVCLSLLGTWPGPKWSPLHSNLYQILVSIQGLILGSEQPYYLEPGHGGWEGDVKGGDYLKQGQTLTGKKVKSEIGVPTHVQQYNNVLRVGNVRFAMLETLCGSQRHLDMFNLPILTHFYCNRATILQEVQSWPVKPPSSTDLDEQQGSFGQFNSSPPGDLKDLVPKLEQRFSVLVYPPSDKQGDQADEDMGDKKIAAIPSLKVAPSKKSDDLDLEQDAMQVDTTAEAAGPDASLQSNALSKTETLRARMQEAASSNNFVLAGQLQEQLNRIVDLERRMHEAAAEGNFVRAGRLQEQIEALAGTTASTAPVAAYTYDGSAQNENHGGFGSDDSMGGSNGNHHSASIGGLEVGKSVFVPPGHPSSYGGGANHSWGSGSALSSTATSAPTTTANTPSNEATLPGVIIRKAPPASSVCRLRFRLPSGGTHIEEFGRNAPLSDVYGHLESVMSANQQSGERKGSAGSQAHDVAPPLRTSGAWAQPQSSAGFTLLLSHPKREFNLEMHGTKTLTELGLVPSATLTVMKCADRGLARRGEVESRLAEANGGAMDVDGLTYEGLLELTERVGAAKPTAITQELLDQNTVLLSPSELKNGYEGNCPICLGEYDPTDTNKTLRKLYQCGHLMHAACLATWLGTKSSCPICKTDVVEA